MTINVTLTAAEAEEISIIVNGSGGLQSLIRTLQQLLQPNGEIQLTDAQVGRIIRYMGYGPGGMEGRLQRAFLRPFTEIMHRA